MGKYNSKTFYCTLKGPFDNITIIDYIANDNLPVVEIIVPVHSNISYPIELNLDDLLLKMIYHFNIKSLFIYAFKLNKYFNLFIKCLKFPFKLSYNILYYFSNIIKGSYPLILTDDDKIEINKILNRYGLDINHQFMIKKEDLKFIHKLEYILFGEIELICNIEYYLNRLKRYYK